MMRIQHRGATVVKPATLRAPRALSVRHATPLQCLARRWYAQAAQSLDESRVRRSSLHVPSEARFNEIGIQQLSSSVHPQIFSAGNPRPSQDLIDLAKDHLTRHELLGKNQDSTPSVGLELPPLQGKTLDEHFYKLGMDVAEPYLSLAKEYIRANAPPKPRKWVRRSGWTKYSRDGSSEAVDAPNESLLTFDTEVMYKETSYACMACAASPTAWYAWISPWLLEESESDKHLIPLGDPDKPKIVVGHNIGYDRARIAEEYSMRQSNSFFMDTMSLHVAVNGMCSRQRPKWVKHRKERDLRDKIAASDENVDLNSLLQSGKLSDEEEELWIGRSSINSLRDVAKFHCDITIDKARREYFGELDRQGIREKLDELLDYCAADVEITHRVYKKVFPLFIELCPHPVSFAAIRFMAQEILPINESWHEYIQNAEGTYQKMSEGVQQRLVDLAHKALESKDDPDYYNNDPWLGQLDWSGQEIKMVKGKRKNDPPRPSASQKMPGMPKWYKDLYPKAKGPINLTTRTRVSPIILRLAWDGFPLVWSDKYGWTYRVPGGTTLSDEMKAAVCDMAEEENLKLRDDRQNLYLRVPHKDGPTARCTNPMAKGYLQYFENGRLTSAYPYAKEALAMNASCSYWISARERIKSQMAVLEGEAHLNGKAVVPSVEGVDKSESDQKIGYILPQVIPMGTITRRAVENTWLTASNAKKNRVGSELKAMVKAPPGHVFVGADVDSEELWIASLVGDAQFKLHGGNAIGFMTLEGTKSAGTDLHSRTASILGISRNDAKIFNYGRIYGAGLKFAAQLLRQFNPTLTEAQTMETASKLYQETKGKKTLRKILHERGFWRGGTESFVFNKLEDFAEQEQPRTPVLGAGITEALMKRFLSKGGFITSRINWAIQSSGVDYLHLLIVGMDFLTRRFNIQARLCITVHDEIRYLVKEEDKYRAAMALQVANLWTRAMFSQQVGIEDLPQSCAFFSAVDIDKVLRKEVDLDCVTPSHPNPIPVGESIDIEALLAKGDAAYLDPAIQPTPGQAPNPDKYAYTPRTPVMETLNKKIDMSLLKAQITSDDNELKEIIKSVRPPPPPRAKRIGTGAGVLGDGFANTNKSSPKASPKPYSYQQAPELVPVYDPPRKPFINQWEQHHAKGNKGPQQWPNRFTNSGAGSKNFQGRL